MSSRVIRAIITSASAPKAIGPYSQAVAVGDTVYLSGQVGLDPLSGNMVEGGIEAEAHQESEDSMSHDICLLFLQNEEEDRYCSYVFKNISEVLAASGLTFKDVVKCTVLLASMEEYPTLNKIYGTYFTEKHPARAAYQVAGLPKNARVEIECIAVKGIKDE